MKHYWYDTTTANFDKLTDWCEQQFGPSGDPNEQDCRWYIWYGMINFFRKEDYVMFCLRWSNES